MAALESAFERQNLKSVEAVRSEGFPATHIYGDFIYERFKVNRRNVWYLRHRAKPFEDELGYDAFRSPDEVRHNIRPGGEVVFVKPVRGKYAGEEIAVATRETRRGVLVTGAVVVKEGYRKKGIGTHLAEDAILRHKPISATGRTRRWEVLRTYEKLEYQGRRLLKTTSPIDTGGRLSQEAQNKLPIILELKELEQFDLETGLYSNDTLPRLLGTDTKDFRPPPKNDLEGTRVYNALREHGVRPELGNAVRYWDEFDQDILEKASAAYNPREVIVFPTKPLISRIIASILGLSFFTRIQPSFKK